MANKDKSKAAPKKEAAAKKETKKEVPAEKQAKKGSKNSKGDKPAKKEVEYIVSRNGGRYVKDVARPAPPHRKPKRIPPKRIWPKGKKVRPDLARSMHKQKKEPGYEKLGNVFGKKGKKGQAPKAEKKAKAEKKQKKAGEKKPKRAQVKRVRPIRITKGKPIAFFVCNMNKVITSILKQKFPKIKEVEAGKKLVRVHIKFSSEEDAKAAIAQGKAVVHQTMKVRMMKNKSDKPKGYTVLCHINKLKHSLRVLIKREMAKFHVLKIGRIKAWGFKATLASHEARKRICLCRKIPLFGLRLSTEKAVPKTPSGLHKRRVLRQKAGAAARAAKIIEQNIAAHSRAKSQTMEAFHTKRAMKLRKVLGLNKSEKVPGWAKPLPVHLTKPLSKKKAEKGEAAKKKEETPAPKGKGAKEEKKAPAKAAAAPAKKADAKKADAKKADAKKAEVKKAAPKGKAGGK